MYLEKRTITIPKTGSKSYDQALAAMSREIGEFTPERVVQYLNNLREKGCSPATINHKIAAVKKALTLAATLRGEDSALFRLSLAEFFKQSALKTVKMDCAVKREDVLAPQELKELLALADEKTALIIEALYYSAARVSELLSIRLEKCTVKGAAVHCEIVGKGRKARTVFLPLPLFRRICNTFKSQTYLFENKTHGPLNRTNVWRSINAAGKAMGWENLHCHTIRHSWATANLERLGIHKVSRYLGHSDIAITSKFYLHNQATADEILANQPWQRED